MNYQHIILEMKEGIATLTLNRPKQLNAIDRTMTDELGRALAQLGEDEKLRALVLTGAGRAFCTGADIAVLEELTSPLAVRNWTQEAGRIVLALANLEKPVIAKVNGLAVGIGCSIALATDIIIASENAQFSFIFRQVGLIPDGGALYNLARLVGPAKAKELIFTGKMISAKQAEKIGLINKQVPGEELDKKVDTLAKQLATGPTAALGIAKKILNKGLNMDLSSVLECEALGQTIAFGTEDFKEGTKAFLQKRAPKFKGR